MNDRSSLHTPNPRRSKWFVRTALSVGGFCVIAAVSWAVYSMMNEKGPEPKRVVQIALVKLPPPPPPPPPPEVKPPEPQVKEEVPVPDPEPAQKADDTPPASEQLGLDADGSGGGDNFGLAAKKGGQDITLGGGGGGDSRAQFAWFTGLVQNQLQRELQKNKKLRGVDYRVTLRIWLDPAGQIERYELTSSSGNPAVDRDLELALAEMPRFQQQPPDSMPQPIRLRVTSRAAS